MCTPVKPMRGMKRLTLLPTWYHILDKPSYNAAGISYLSTGPSPASASCLLKLLMFIAKKIIAEDEKSLVEWFWKNDVGNANQVNK